MPTLIFVYGTLKRGCSNHHWLAGQRFLGPAVTQPSYRLHSLSSYPGMTATADGQGQSIPGEIWEIDDEGLAKLDLLEGIDEGEYERVPAKLSGEWAEANVQTYLYLRSVAGFPLLKEWPQDLSSFR